MFRRQAFGSVTQDEQKRKWSEKKNGRKVELWFCLENSTLFWTLSVSEFIKNAFRRNAECTVASAIVYCIGSH